MTTRPATGQAWSHAPGEAVVPSPWQADNYSIGSTKRDRFHTHTGLGLSKTGMAILSAPDSMRVALLSDLARAAILSYIQAPRRPYAAAYADREGVAYWIATVIVPDEPALSGVWSTARTHRRLSSKCPQLLRAVRGARRWGLEAASLRPVAVSGAPS
jgi:hypothetical protein